MDVDRKTFLWQLPRILNAIATAHFVSFDLELSGIPGKVGRKIRRFDEINGTKQTLQERYQEAKEAAGKYQVLQIGLTCVVEDNQSGIYTVRPYNFFLNPVPEEKLDIERVFSYQSGAVEFLLAHKFRMEAPFLQGVNYLSREEEALARRIELSKRDKEDIQIRSSDVDSLEFVKRVRHEIETWKSRTTAYPDFINISSPGFELSAHTERGLNNFQKRLVHQLVRAEHPGLVTISRPGFIQITSYNKKREDAISQSKKLAFEERVVRQIGFRWIVEGMVRGDLSAIDPKTFTRDIGGDPYWIDLNVVNRRFEELKVKLADKLTVLVGHNAFMDLINFYQCFFGQLPDRVEDFQSIMHQIFPMVVDTKYLASHSSKVMNDRSGLEELSEDLAKLTEPVIAIHKETPNYTSIQPLHEAGFDSYLTAMILIRLSSKIEQAGRYVDSDDESYETPPGAHDAKLQTSAKTLATSTPMRTTSHSQSVPQQTENTTSSENAQVLNPKRRFTETPKPSSPTRLTPSAFSHPGRFDLLDSLSDEGGGEQHPSHSPSPPSGPDHVLRPAADNFLPAFKMMPQWDSDFWNVYGNKLRVNGTVEGVCDLWCREMGENGRWGEELGVKMKGEVEKKVEGGEEV